LEVSGRDGARKTIDFLFYRPKKVSNVPHR
jgi:hypothetical protein